VARSGTAVAASDDAPSVLAISRQITENLTASETSSLRERLRTLAEISAGLPGIRGTAVVVFDEDQESTPLTSGTYRLSLREGLTELEALSQLRQLTPQSVPDGGSWVSMESLAVFQEERTIWHLAFPSADQSVSLLATLDADAEPDRALSLLRQAGPFLAAAIRFSVLQQAWSRFEKLQQLARDTLSREPWDFQAMVASLCEHFDAEAVTLLLNEREELRLSATTDRQLREGPPVSYSPGEGLTGHVFQSGKPIRLHNSKDPLEIRRITGLDRKGPRYPEHDSQGAITVQFLGVPLCCGGKVVGVLRMTRKEGVAKFTREDEKALQFFADFLGAAVAPAWELLLQRSILRSVTEAIAVTRQERDPDGHIVARIVMVSPGTENLLGWSELDLVGQDFRTLYAPGEYEKIRQVLQPVLEVARSGRYAELAPILTRMRRADGTQLPVTVSYRLLVNPLVQPPTFYTIGLARTEQHHHFLELLDDMKVAYFRASLDGRTLETTLADSEITGYSSEELKTRIRRGELYPDPEIRERLLNRAREQRGHLLRELVQMKRKNDELFWAEGDFRILKDSEGQEIGCAGLYRDVSDRIRLQGFLNEETGRVLTDQELFTRLKRDAEFHLDYISGLSHQLQTPLGSLIETLRNFEKGELDQKALQSRLPYVIGQALACTRMVRNLSNMDKILRSEPFSPETIPLSKLAVETTLDFRHLLVERRLKLIIDDSLRKVSVQGHPELLRQVVVNLVDNAIKYSLPETTIHIRGRWTSGQSILEVSNRGLPISAGERERIFERGFRTRKAQAWIPHGTGLGLWLVHKIVEAHNATIRCLEVEEGGELRVLFQILFPT
jgi:PAS domain S-box-containing protein